MAAAHLKVFPVFLLFIMLTSGSLRRIWLGYRNYISFVGKYFLLAVDRNQVAALVLLYLVSNEFAFWIQLLLSISS